MAICTLPVNAGVLGMTELTVSYKYQAPRGTRAESASIYWIKVGGPNGIEVDVSDDCIDDVLIPGCLADWKRADHLSLEAA